MNWGWDNSGRNHTSTHTRTTMEASYIDSWSFLARFSFLLVSGIIGSSIFLPRRTSLGIAQPLMFLLIWVLGAVISLFACAAFGNCLMFLILVDSTFVCAKLGDLVAFLYG